MLFKKACIPFFLVVLVIAIMACGETVSPTQESQTVSVPADTPIPWPSSTPVPPTETPLPIVVPTEEPAPETEKVSDELDRRDPANIPDFYLERSHILGGEDPTDGTISVILVSFNETQEHLIAELVVYPVAKFEEETSLRLARLENDPSFQFLNRDQQILAIARWRPPTENTLFLGWGSLSERENGMVPLSIYKRAEGGGLMYVGEDLIPVPFRGGSQEITATFFQIFRAYEEEP